MKASLLQLVSSSVALGLMAGAVGLQWFQMEGVNLSGTEGFGPVSSVFGGSELVPTMVSWETSAPGSEPLSSGARLGAGVQQQEVATTVMALNEIVSVLKGLQEENRALREQVKEVNGGLTELEFRTDMLSGSFRPLKASADAAPMRQSGLHPLLPPKRR